MKVDIEDAIEKLYLKPFNITREKVIEAVTKEDVRKPIKFGDYTVILYLKNFGNHYLFVDGRWNRDSSTLLISAVYVVDQQIIQNMGIENPLAVLEQFAKEFGHLIEIGDQKSKFLLDAKMPIPFVKDYEDFSKVLYSNIKILDGETDMSLGDVVASPETLGDRYYANITFAYFINFEKYSQNLRSNNFI